MAVIFKLWLGILYLSAVATALRPWYFQKRDTPTLPSEDPWYEAPEGYEDAKPGEILKNREVPNPIAAFNKIEVEMQTAHHVMYRSTDNHGEASISVTTILVPKDADGKKIVSYQVAEDAASPNCGPSYVLQKDHTDSGTTVTQSEFLLMIAALQKGWVVIAPDFQGTNAAYLANIRAGQAVLDGIRAALSSTEFTGISSDAVVTMWGYSGGSLASGFAAELQATYASDLKIAGAAIGGLVPKIYPVLTLANEGEHTGLIPAGILGLCNEYPEVKALIDDALVPEKADDFKKALNMCFSDDSDFYKDQDIFTYFTNKDIFKHETLQKVLNENDMGSHNPAIPMMIYKAKKDEISEAADTDKLVEDYCAAGTIVQHNVDLTSNHSTMAIIGAPDALIWLTARMEGEAPATECKKTTELVGLLDPEALAVMTKAVADALSALIGGST